MIFGILIKVEKMVGCMENNPKIELLAANYNTFFSEKDNGSGSKLYASNSKKNEKRRKYRSFGN